MTPEQRYRLEQAKNNTPSTSAFIWWIPVFLFFAWMCKDDVSHGFLQGTTIHTSYFEKYRHSDPVCGGDDWCILGWKL